LIERIIPVDALCPATMRLLTRRQRNRMEQTGETRSFAAVEEGPERIGRERAAVCAGSRDRLARCSIEGGKHERRSFAGRGDRVGGGRSDMIATPAGATRARVPEQESALLHCSPSSRSPASTRIALGDEDTPAPSAAPGSHSAIMTPIIAGGERLWLGRRAPRRDHHRQHCRSTKREPSSGSGGRGKLHD